MHTKENKNIEYINPNKENKIYTTKKIFSLLLNQK